MKSPNNLLSTQWRVRSNSHLLKLCAPLLRMSRLRNLSLITSKWAISIVSTHPLVQISTMELTTAWQFQVNTVCQWWTLIPCSNHKTMVTTNTSPRKTWWLASDQRKCQLRLSISQGAQRKTTLSKAVICQIMQWQAARSKRASPVKLTLETLTKAYVKATTPPLLRAQMYTQPCSQTLVSMVLSQSLRSTGVNVKSSTLSELNLVRRAAPSPRNIPWLLSRVSLKLWNLARYLTTSIWWTRRIPSQWTTQSWTRNSQSQ